jgi:hypothetical protein
VIIAFTCFSSATAKGSIRVTRKRKEEKEEEIADE